MNKIGEASLVIYKPKNELGLVKEVISQDKVRVWYHTGGTSAVTPTEYLKRIATIKAYSTKFTNEYAKLSLLERQERMNENRDVSDLIDNDDVRDNIKKMYEIFMEGQNG